MRRVRINRDIFMIIIWILNAKYSNIREFKICFLNFERTITFDDENVFNNRFSLFWIVIAIATIVKIFENTNFRIVDDAITYHYVIVNFDMQLQCILKLVNCYKIALREKF